jgi:hypothetical protein
MTRQTYGVEFESYDVPVRGKQYAAQSTGYAPQAWVTLAVR